MRVYVRARNYRNHVRSQTIAGLVNNPEGNWVASPGPCSPGVVKQVLYGTLGKRSKGVKGPKKVRKVKEVE